MCRNGLLALLIAFGALVARPAESAHSQEVVDRIVARVEGDVILLSEVRALRDYQQLVDGKSESDAQILDRLIDQWIVRNEAETARFPRPTDTEIARGMERVESAFASPQEYAQRRKQCGLTEADVRSMVASQLYLTNYLDSRFRSSVQIEPAQVEEFYRTSVLPRAKARKQTPPTLEASREYIQQALTQQQINEETERWLKESHSHLHVEKLPEAGAK
jgi:parvulin-like peptidyl-prolyl isomerase